MLRLTLEREKKGWTKMKLGFEAEMHPNIIGKLESKKIFPYPKWKNQLAQVFGVPADELFEEVQ